MELERFFFWARERYSVMLKKEAGAERPWTSEQVLQDFRFCNVFREDDKVTRWFRENVREHMRDDLRVGFACVAFRYFNLPSTGQLLLDYELFRNWDPDIVRHALANQKPLITGAYMVKTPLRKPKLEGLIEILEPVWEGRQKIVEQRTLEATHAHLMSFPWIGPFMAYQAVSDLRFTEFLENASDINTWTSLGPGSARGLSRLLYGKPEGLNAGNPRHNVIAVGAMRDILEASKQAIYWPAEWPRWELSTVQHWLCEYDKIQRTLLLEGSPKQRYDGRR